MWHHVAFVFLCLISLSVIILGPSILLWICPSFWTHLLSSSSSSSHTGTLAVLWTHRSALPHHLHANISFSLEGLPSSPHHPSSSCMAWPLLSFLWASVTFRNGLSGPPYSVPPSPLCTTPPPPTLLCSFSWSVSPFSFVCLLPLPACQLHETCSLLSLLILCSRTLSSAEHIWAFLFIVLEYMFISVFLLVVINI